jgi:hypothetical protein
MRNGRYANVEGLMFYWITWAIWIYLTFILKKESSYRMKLSAAILLVIILSNFHFSIWIFEINLSGLFLILICYSAIGKEKTKTISYFYLCSFIVSIAYVTFHLFEIFDPVWLIIDKVWMLGICLGYIALLLQKTLKGRLLAVICGTLQGEILYAYILKAYGFMYEVSSFAYLDSCALTAALLLGWSCIENASSFFDRYGHVMGKGKQKST